MLMMMMMMMMMMMVIKMMVIIMIMMIMMMMINIVFKIMIVYMMIKMIKMIMILMMFEFIFQALECGICEDLFMLHGDRVPRLLTCGHSVCHDCLSKLTIRGEVLLCPFDREPTNIGDSGIWGLKKNFALLDLLERLQLDKENGEVTLDDEEVNNRIRCDENEKHLATLYCLVCSTHLCDDCSKETHSTKTLSRHKRVLLCDKPKGIAINITKIILM